jgi:hypothetical protein
MNKDKKDGTMASKVTILSKGIVAASSEVIVHTIISVHTSATMFQQ